MVILPLVQRRLKFNFLFRILEGFLNYYLENDYGFLLFCKYSAYSLSFNPSPTISCGSQLYNWKGIFFCFFYLLLLRVKSLPNCLEHEASFQILWVNNCVISVGQCLSSVLSEYRKLRPDFTSWNYNFIAVILTMWQISAYFVLLQWFQRTFLQVILH